jgi:ABC-type methionine transport system permease subunit
VVILIFLIATLLRSASIVVISTLALYAVILVIIVATFFFARGLRKELARRFPNQNTKGAVAYGLLRSSNIRKMRLPKPAVKRGQKP